MHLISTKYYCMPDASTPTAIAVGQTSQTAGRCTEWQQTPATKGCTQGSCHAGKACPQLLHGFIYSC